MLNPSITAFPPDKANAGSLTETDTFMRHNNVLEVVCKCGYFVSKNRLKILKTLFGLSFHTHNHLMFFLQTLCTISHYPSPVEGAGPRLFCSRGKSVGLDPYLRNSRTSPLIWASEPHICWSLILLHPECFYVCFLSYHTSYLPSGQNLLSARAHTHTHPTCPASYHHR